MYSTVYYVLRKISTPLVTRKCMCPLTVGLDPGTLLAHTYISAYIVCLFLSAHIYINVHCVYICYRACVRVPHIDTRKCAPPHPGWELSGSRRSLPGSQSPRVSQGWKSFHRWHPKRAHLAPGSHLICLIFLLTDFFLSKSHWCKLHLLTTSNFGKNGLDKKLNSHTSIQLWTFIISINSLSSAMINLFLLISKCFYIRP